MQSTDLISTALFILTEAFILILYCIFFRGRLGMSKFEKHKKAVIQFFMTFNFYTFYNQRVLKRY